MEQRADAENVGRPEAAGVAGVPEPVLASLLDPAELRAWRAFLTRHARVARRLEANLIARSNLQLAEYDALFELALAEGKRLRMSELELLDRERRATERRIRQAKFPVTKSLDSFDFLAILSLNKAMVLELAQCEFLDRRENVLLLGNSGTVIANLLTRACSH